MNVSKKYISSVANALGDKSSFTYKFLLQHALEWDKAIHLQYGERQQCFSNAIHMAIQNCWYYVEGYAVSHPDIPIPLEHAWCVNHKGLVVDPTWDSGIAYYGVSFYPVRAVNIMAHAGYYGIFCNLHILARKKMDIPDILTNALVTPS